MGRKNKRRNGGGNWSSHPHNRPYSQPALQAPAAIAAPALDSPLAQIEEMHKEAMEAVQSVEDVAAVGDDPLPPGATLETLWKTVREARDVFRAKTFCAEKSLAEAKALRESYETRYAELEQRAEELTQRSASLDSAEKDLRDRAAEVDRLAKDVAARELQLADAQFELRQRELNAEAGFLEQKKAALAALDASAEEMREAAARLEQSIGEQRLAWAEEQRERRRKLQEELTAAREAGVAELEARLREREDELARREAQARSERFELDGTRLRLEYEEQHLKEWQQELDRRVERRAAAVREELEHQLKATKAQLDQARKDRDQYEEILRRREVADRQFGQRTPEQVVKEIDALRAERDSLKAALDLRPDVEAVARLEALEKERETWQAEQAELRRQNSELKRRITYAQADSTERESQRDYIRSLESQRQFMLEAHRQIRAEIDQVIGRADSKVPFPACSAMDADSELQAAGPTQDGIRDLAAFAEDLRHRIAVDPDHPERRLFYSIADVRAFLGGLAMSPLVLLQGISGTGKTSLPIAFARAVGTKATIVEVQAGWRDPQDLVGHYNAFEKRFYEREFLKALYRARTPRWADTIQIVLLDEMNLSHPEQYFSDLLSALELRPEDRRLVLMSHALDHVPALFDGGNRLAIPPNVWFVGTANHDETTKDFADKTYDRAHVMQFPSRPVPFEIKPIAPRPPISYSALQNAFEEAVRRDGKDGRAAESAIGFLDANVREPLSRHFEISWGPRLERQLKRYVPVVVGAGGSIGEATDHLLAMRLLRKLKNRHDNRPEHLDALRKAIESAWPQLDRKTNPERSIEVLISELRRLGRDGDDAR